MTPKNVTFFVSSELLSYIRDLHKLVDSKINERKDVKYVSQLFNIYMCKTNETKNVTF